MLVEQIELDRETLVLLIVKKRNEMLMLADRDGLSSCRTIRCSQELDSLLNSLHKLQLAS
ncbi:Spo0E family sporulation regulatory protein-aspartic acid phosphatase [Virgibacillus sp. DJP39]|uniref:Spo0E family sporulation regulatory protein-aspartic acid phosphatase n=1 Tax=Virgibacillus sp. DJP39 TaxID=3409790 RepID=UPI003BB77C78